MWWAYTLCGFGGFLAAESLEVLRYFKMIRRMNKQSQYTVQTPQDANWRIPDA